MAEMFKGPNPYGDMPDDVPTGVVRYNAVRKTEDDVVTGPFQEKSAEAKEEPPVALSPSELLKRRMQRREELEAAMKPSSDPGPSPIMNTRRRIQDFDGPVDAHGFLTAKDIRVLRAEMAVNVTSDATPDTPTEEDVLKPVSAKDLKTLLIELGIRKAKPE